MADRIGQQLGNYRLIRLLGRGGFAEVYLGEHLRLGMQAAVKVLSTRLDSKDDVERFEKEARTVASLKHPHIVRVLDYDVEEETPFLVMDYASGGTLRQRYPKGTVLPLTTIISYVKQIADALQYAHDQRVIHRDVKPENMLVGEQQELLLSDFGIAIVTQSSRYQSTQNMSGTMAYIAPEQIQGHPRPASDQYSLGIVVYEWLSGDYPFHGSFPEMVGQHLSAPPPSLRGKVSTIAPTIEQVVLTALEKDPHKRFGSVKAFAIALEQASQSAPSRSSILSQAPTIPDQPRQPAQEAPLVIPLSQQRITPPPSEVAHTPPARPDHSQQTSGASGTLDRPEPAHQRISRRAVVVGLAGLAAVGVAGGSLVWLVHSQQPAPPATQASPTLPPTQRPTPSPSPTPIPIGTTLFTYTGHGDSVSSIAWSPDGKYIVSGSGGSQNYDTTVQVWEALSGNRVLTYMAHTFPVFGVAWSPDGKRIASVSSTFRFPLQGRVRVCDAFSGKNELGYNGHSSGVVSVAWSPDGKYVATGSYDQTVQVWDALSGHTIFTYNGHSAVTWAVTWSPDSKRIASASADRTVQVWDALSGNNVYTYSGHSNSNGVFAAAWSPDGKYIASAGYDYTMQVWDASTGNRIQTFHHDSEEVITVAWSPDSKRVASGGYDGTVRIWNALSGNHVFTYSHPNVWDIAWSPKSTYIASSNAVERGSTVKVWQAE